MPSQLQPSSCPSPGSPPSPSHSIPLVASLFLKGSAAQLTLPCPSPHPWLFPLVCWTHSSCHCSLFPICPLPGPSLSSLLRHQGNRDGQRAQGPWPLLPPGWGSSSCSLLKFQTFSGSTKFSFLQMSPRKSTRADSFKSVLFAAAVLGPKTVFESK